MYEQQQPRLQLTLPAARCRALLLASIMLNATACSDSPTLTAQQAVRGFTLSAFSGDGQIGEVASTLREPLVVRLENSLGRGVGGVTVRLSGDSEAQSTRTDAQGLASFHWRLLSVTGKQRVVAQAIVDPKQTSNPSAEFSATAVAGPAVRIERVTSEHEAALPGTTLDTVVAKALDRFGNSANAGVTWTVTRGGGSVRPPLAADQLGAIRAIWTLGPEVGEQELTANGVGVTQKFFATASAPFVVTQVTVGGTHSCALSASGGAYCWGGNEWGQLGTGGSIQKVPVRVAGGLAFSALAAGQLHTCGLTIASEAYCWGSTYASADVAAPERVGGAPASTALAVGVRHACGLTRAGRIYCWGDNAFGQLGDGSNRSTPATLGLAWPASAAPVVGDLTFVTLAAAHFTTCAIATTGDTYCWGSNDGRTLGGDVPGKCRMAADPYYIKEDYDVPCSTAPVRVIPEFRLTSLAAGGYGLCGVTTNAELVCWGHNLARPQVASPGRFTKAWVVNDHVCGMEIGGRVSCWRAWHAPNVPVVPPYGDNQTLLGLSSSGGTACGIAGGPPGIAYCWGTNYQGQLGDGTRYHRSHATPVVAPPGS